MTPPACHLSPHTRGSRTFATVIFKGGKQACPLLLASADSSKSIPELSFGNPLSLKSQKFSLEESEVDFFCGNMSPMYSYNK